MLKCCLKSLVIVCVLTLMPSLAWAHFPWLVRSDDGKLNLFFGEGLNDRNYKMPASIAKAELFQVTGQGERVAVKVQPIESDALIGLQSNDRVPADVLAESQMTFGIYNGSRLDYYTLHCGKLAASLDEYQSRLAKLDLNAMAVDTDSGIDVYVTWKGKPLTDVPVHLYGADGQENAEGQSNAQGKVSFTDQQCRPGINGIMLGHKIKESGKLGEKAYDSQSHYLTLTFTAPAASSQAAQAKQ